MSGPSEEQAETFTFSQVQKILQMQENTITNFLKMNMELLQTKIDQVSSNLYKEIGSVKQELIDVKKDVLDLKTSVTFTEDNIDDKIKQIENRVTSIQPEQLHEIEFIKEKANDLENRSRRSNIRVDGLLEADNETWEETEQRVKDMMKDTLGIDKDIIFERAHRVGDKRVAKEKKRHRTVIAKLHNWKDKSIIFRQAQRVKLSTKQIYISDDFSEITRQRRQHIERTQKLLREKGNYAVIRNLDKLDTNAPNGWVNRVTTEDKSDR